MPAESGLHTAFLPSQQFCDAFTAPLPPQMLPGGLQAWPPEQVGGEEAFFCSQRTPYPLVLIWSALPPQQAPLGFVQKPPEHVEFSPYMGAQAVLTLLVVQGVVET